MATNPNEPTAEVVATQKSAPRPATKKRSRRKKANHGPLKVMLTAGAVMATWMGSGWMAQQDALAAQITQPEPATVAYVTADGTVTELQPVPQVVTKSKSSK